MVPLLQPEHHWSCPNCDLTDVTHDPTPHTRMHTCPGLRGLTAPMVPDGMDCRVIAVEREDYVGREQVQTDEDGRPVMAIVTARADGSNDAVVLAPVATARVGG